MKLSIKRFALSCSILWGLAIFIVSTANMLWPEYGAAFLNVVSSIYPGYKAMQGLSSIVIGTVYTLVDGAIAGVIFSWLYNFLPE